MKKILKYANQLFSISLLLLGLSLLFSKGVLAPGAGIFFISMAFVYAAWYFNKNGKKSRKANDDYFF